MQGVTTVGPGTGIENRGDGLVVQDYRGIQTSPTINNFGPSINTTNQSGGNNTINVGPTRLLFDPAIADQLVGKLPSDKPISALIVGSDQDQQTGVQYLEYLQAHGFKIVQVDRTYSVMPLPEHYFTVFNRPEETRLEISATLH
jgi:hypothetical protein